MKINVRITGSPKVHQQRKLYLVTLMLGLAFIFAFAGCGEKDDTFTVNCTPACTTNSECSDGNSSTVDSCLNPNTCSAVCVHTQGTPACSYDTDCEDGIYTTYDTCENPGTLSAYCLNQTCCSLTTMPDPLEPVDGIMIYSSTPVLSWEPVTCARYYTLDIRNSDGESMISPGKIKTSSYQYDGPAFADNMNYAWQITSYNGCGAEMTGAVSFFSKSP